MWRWLLHRKFKQVCLAELGHARWSAQNSGESLEQLFAPYERPVEFADKCNSIRRQALWLKRSFELRPADWNQLANARATGRRLAGQVQSDLLSEPEANRVK